jgi:hypothetical protein
MADDLASLTNELRRLNEVRRGGVKSYEIRDRRLEYRTGAELAAAIAEVQRRISVLNGREIRMVRFSSSKGI